MDLENVMRSGRIACCDMSIAWLRQKYPQAPGKVFFLDTMAQTLNHPNAQTEAFFAKTRGGRSEAQNFRDALYRDKLEADFSGPLCENPGSLYEGDNRGLCDLGALVLFAAKRLRKRSDYEAIVRTLVKAVSECIEDDGHRVCQDGISQRFVTVLQGYYLQIVVDVPEPRMLLTALAEEFDARFTEGAEPDEEDLQAFVEAAIGTARLEFSSAPDCALFGRELRDYMKVQYGFVAA